MLEQIGRPTRDQAAARALGAALVAVAGLFVFAELLTAAGVAPGLVVMTVAVGVVAGTATLVRWVRQAPGSLRR